MSTCKCNVNVRYTILNLHDENQVVPYKGLGQGSRDWFVLSCINAQPCVPSSIYSKQRNQSQTTTTLSSLRVSGIKTRLLAWLEMYCLSWRTITWYLGQMLNLSQIPLRITLPLCNSQLKLDSEKWQCHVFIIYGMGYHTKVKPFQFTRLCRI